MSDDKEMWDKAMRLARDALADIADKQMATWEKFPSMDSPTTIIARKIFIALSGREP